jgi:hypothetical protein
LPVKGILARILRFVGGIFSGDSGNFQGQGVMGRPEKSNLPSGRDWNFDEIVTPL